MRSVQQPKRDRVVLQDQVFGRVSLRGRLLGGFTLIELLVVVAIISLLIALLVPALGEAKAQAKASVCMANLRGIGNAYATYVSNNDGVGYLGNFQDSITAPDAPPNTFLFVRQWFASTAYVSVGPSPVWDSTGGYLYPYFMNTKLTDCPALTDEPDLQSPGIPRVAYGYNSFPSNFYKSLKLSSYGFPADTVALEDAAFVNNGILQTQYQVGLNSAKAKTFAGRHPNGVGNVLWYDGHVSNETPYVCSLATSYTAGNQPYMNIYIANHIGMITPVTAAQAPESTLVYSSYPSTVPINLDYYIWINKDLHR